MADEPGHAPATAPGVERLVVALVRGVHGLRGAVRVEVLTDRPEQRFRPGVVLYREGDATPLTIASAEAVQDGPGWRLRFEEVTSREAADTLRGAYLETEVRPRGRSRAWRGLLARGRRRHRDRYRRHGPGHRPGHLSRRRDRGLHRAWRALRHVRPARRPRVHPDLRPEARRDRRRRRGPGPATAARSDPTGDDRPRAPRRKSPKRKRARPGASRRHGARRHAESTSLERRARSHRARRMPPTTEP